MNFFFLFAIAIIISIPGVIFFILGLVNKNKNQWVPGLIGIVLAITLTFVGVYQIMSFTSKVMEKSYEQAEHNMHYTDSLIESNNTNNHYNFDIENAEQYPVFMLKGENRYFFHIYVEERLCNKLDIIEVIEKDVSNTDAIELIIMFEEDFHGSLHFACYDDMDLISFASNSERIDAEEGTEQHILIPIDEEFNLEETDYCLIK